MNDDDKTFINVLAGSPRWGSEADKAQRIDALTALAEAVPRMVDHLREPWVAHLGGGVIRRVLPLALRAAASRVAREQANALRAAAARCEDEGTIEAAKTARAVAARAYEAVDPAYIYAAAAVYDAYAAAMYAVDGPFCARDAAWAARAAARCAGDIAIHAAADAAIAAYDAPP